MKKILALILALTMVFAFAAACGKTDTPANTPSTSGSAPPPSSSAPPPSSSKPPSAPPSAVAPPSASGPIDNTFTGEIGMFDPDYDYFANPRYKVTYIVSNNTSGLYTQSALAYQHWADKMNIEFGGLLDFGGDNDALFSQLPQLARDNDGLIFDADSSMYDRVYEVMKDTGTPWHSFMAAPRDYTYPTAPLLGPYVGFEQYDVGVMFADYLIGVAAEFWPKVPIEEFGFIVVDFSVAPPLHERAMGCYDRLQVINPDMAANRYFEADTAIKFFDADTSQQVVSTILSMNPDIEYWLVFGEVDDMAQGAAAALELAGLEDNSFVSAFGGSALVKQWDSGVQTAWRSVFYLPQTIFTEAIIGSLYAMMNGDAKAEELFPQWHNKNEDTRYGSFSTRLLPFYEIRFEDYKHMLAWSDIYAESNMFPGYPRDGITRDSYPNSVPVPAHFK